MTGVKKMLVFKRDELLYDVRNYSFLEGDLMQTDNGHARHQVFDVGESGNVDRVTRVLNLAHAACVEFLFPYTKVETVDDICAVSDDVLAVPDEYVIELSLPMGFSQTTVDLLRHLIHEYMVCHAMADWMSITNPKSQANWQEKANVLKQKMQTVVVSRMRRMRRKSKPF